MLRSIHSMVNQDAKLSYIKQWHILVWERKELQVLSQLEREGRGATPDRSKSTGRKSRKGIFYFYL